MLALCSYVVAHDSWDGHCNQTIDKLETPSPFRWHLPSRDRSNPDRIQSETRLGSDCSKLPAVGYLGTCQSTSLVRNSTETVPFFFVFLRTFNEQSRVSRLCPSLSTEKMIRMAGGLVVVADSNREKATARGWAGLGSSPFFSDLSMVL